MIPWWGTGENARKDLVAARRIGGKGGGSDKGSGGGALLLAVGVAVVLGAGGTSVVGGTAASGTSASSSTSSGARGEARVGNRDSQAAEVRLARQGIRVTARITDDAADCGEHSYGQARDFFQRRPCAGLHRAQFEMRDRNGDVVLLAVSWVQMPDEAGAHAFHKLVDTDGTGNITELSRERGRYRTVRYTGDIYASYRDGTVVANAQAQPVARRATGLALTSIVTNAVR